MRVVRESHLHGSSYSETEDEEIALNEFDQDEESGANTRALGRMGLGFLFAIAATVCLWSSFRGSNTSQLTTQRSLVEAPQFSAILETQAMSLLAKHDAPESEKAAAQGHISAAIQKVNKFIQQHLSPKQAKRLQELQLSTKQWEDLAAVTSALTNPKVQHVGKVLLDAVRENGADGPAEVGRRVASKLDKSEIQSLAQEVLPPSLRDALRRRADKGGVEKEDIFRVMLDPTGETFARMRADEKDDSKDTDGASTIAKRRLQAAQPVITPPPTLAPRPANYDPWHPYPLTGWELAEGITMIVLISAAELVLHIDLLIPGVNMYWWIHALLFVPAYGLGAGTCYVGIGNIWCQLFLGAVGVNALDAILVWMGLTPS